MYRNAQVGNDILCNVFVYSVFVYSVFVSDGAPSSRSSHGLKAPDSQWWICRT